MSLSQFSVPREQRYFEDYEAGRIYEFGSVVMTEPEIIEFARRFGGIIASGWHTISVAMRLYVDLT
jgi:acyl dehydratase